MRKSNFRHLIGTFLDFLQIGHQASLHGCQIGLVEGRGSKLFRQQFHNKVQIVVALTPDLVKKGLKAGDIAREAAKVVGGSGGGRPDFAQAGGQDISKADAALTKARELITAAL